ncbi:MAG: protein kinase domain-containing protein, partial [Polyangiales bacterium]
MSSKGEVRTLPPTEVARTLLSDSAQVSAVRAREDEAPDAVRVIGPDPALMDERYIPVGELGRGGMGCVTEVVDRTLGRSVARKTLLGDASDGGATLLVSEAQICAQLEHPAIVPVYDLGADGGRPYYTMRVVRGRNLREVLIEERRTRAQLLGVLRQVCLAVDYAHSRGVVHRD